MPIADTFIVENFHKLGFSLNVGSGTYPITWSEIKSYSLTRSLKLSEWECDQLIMMSREYCSWLIKGADKFLNSPWHVDDYDPIVENRLRNAKKLKAKKLSRKSI